MDSRRSRVEEKRKTKTGIILLAAAVVLFLLLIFVGINGAANLAIFADSFKKQPVDHLLGVDKTPPGPPSLPLLPMGVNVADLTASGNAEIGSTVKIYQNDVEVGSMKVGDDAKFSFKLTLNTGANEVWVTATDESGNVSEKSMVREVVYATHPPTLTIDQPQDGFESSDKNVDIKGKTDVDVTVTVNDRIPAVDSDGSFSLKYVLSQGENKLDIIALDLAGNKAEKTITVTYTP